MKTITFFSFKGGVGRSSLLANLGAYWAAQGKQVAMMDLDLAAPGLSFLPQRGDHLEPEFSALGMSDVLSVFEQGFAETPKKLKLLPPSKLLREVRLPSENSGSLLLIEAGSNDWQRASEASEGLLHNIAPIVPDDASSESERQQAWRQLAQAIYTDLSAWRHPRSQQPLDLLLIDCRTGFAELLDFSLSYLTGGQDDHLVLVSALNEQNRAGLRQSLQALQQQDRVPIDELANQVSVVFSPVPISEDEASLQALELGAQVIHDCLRQSISGAPERPPHCSILHYNQTLASSEALLSVTHTHSLYAEEVSKIADWLVGKQQHPDRTLQEISQRVGWEMGWNVPGSRKIPQGEGKRYTRKRPNFLSNLPAWHWPLGASVDNNGRQQLLDKLMPANPSAQIDREVALNSLAYSVSLSKLEKERILAAWSQLNQQQINELLRILEEERNKFSDISSEAPSGMFAILHFALPQWSVLLLGDEQQGWQRYLYPPLQGESLFAYAEYWGEYWGGLAGIALARFTNKAAAEQALLRAEDTSTDPASVIQTAIQSGVGAQMEQAIDWQPVVDWFTARLSQCQDSNTLNSLGIAWKDKVQRYAEAEQAHRQALEIDPKYTSAWVNLGNLLSNNLQRYEEAEQAYRQAIEIDPKEAVAWYNLGVLLSDNLQRYAEAEQAYRQAIEIDPKEAVAWYNLGVLLSDNLQRYAEAEQAYRQAIEIDPKKANAWHNLGHVLSNDLQRYAEAGEAYLKALEIEPKNINIWNNLGNLLSNNLQRYEEAERAYRQAIEIDPKHVNTWFGLGNLLGNKLQRYDEAERAYRQAIEIDPKYTSAWVNLGNLLSNNLQCYEEAEKAYRQAIEIDPKEAVAWYNLGVLLSDNLQRYEEAERAYRQAIEIDPKHVNTWFGLGNLLGNKLQRYDEAERAYRQAIEIDPKYTSAWVNLGNLLSNNLQCYEEAEKAYRQAIEIDPKYTNAWVNLGNLLSNNLQCYEEAEKAYRQAIEIDPKYTSAWVNLGNLLSNNLQCYEEAEKAYRQAIEIDPKEAVAWYNLGVLLSDNLQRYAEAEQACRQAIEIDPKHVNARGNLGYLLAHDLQRYEEAEQTCKDALDIEPKHANNWNLLGLVQKDMGHCKDALQCWEQALNLDSKLTPALVNRSQLRLSLGAPIEELRADLTSACQSGNDRQYYASAVYSALALDSSSEAQQLLEKLKGSGSRWTYFYQWLYTLSTSERVEDHSDAATLEQLKSHSDRKTMLERVYYLAGWRPEARERLQQAAQQLLQMDTSSLKGMPMLARREQLYTRFAAGGSNGGGDPRDLPLICNDASNNQQSNQT